MPIPVDLAGSAQLVATLDLAGPTVEPFVFVPDLGRPNRQPRRGILLRTAASPHAFLDACPHWGTPLASIGAPTFRDGLLVCEAHGAEFDANSGFCVAGPCAGAYLQALTVRHRGSEIDVLAPPLSAAPLARPPAPSSGEGQP